MEITASKFLEAYPEFNCFEEPVINNELDFAGCNINDCVFTGKKYELAIKLMTAHALHLRMDGNSLGQGGIVSSDKVGDLQQNYSTLTPDHGDAYFSQTQYGLKYMQLRSTIATAIRVLD